MSRALLIVDLEATCWERGEHRPGEMETIEIGAVLVEPLGQDMREFQTFVRPVRHPVLSAFCRDLTTIRQLDVDAAGPFPSALARLLEWTGEPRGVLFASWGEYDRRQLLHDCARHRVPYPFDRHWNLKRFVATRLGRKPTGMGRLLSELGLELEGTHHRGLDDARNIWRILRAVAGSELPALLADDGPPAPLAPVDPARLSKFLALVLRHRAGDFGLAPDGEGFVPLEDLVAVVERHAAPRAGRADVLALLADPDQRRFELRGDGVRARYGHSRHQRPVAYPAVEPPETLYHGTSPAALVHVRRAGLQAMGRQYVHLSTSPERAREVGVRRARAPVVLEVRARAAHAAGVAFHAPEASHYLASAIPAEFIRFPPG